MTFFQLFYLVGALISFCLFVKEPPRNWFHPSDTKNARVFGWTLHVIISAIMAYGWIVAWPTLFALAKIKSPAKKSDLR